MIETTKSVCVEPDNGLLILSAKKEEVKHVYHIADGKLHSEEISRTFHGRDMFAPIAAYCRGRWCFRIRARDNEPG